MIIPDRRATFGRGTIIQDRLSTSDQYPPSKQCSEHVDWRSTRKGEFNKMFVIHWKMLTCFVLQGLTPTTSILVPSKAYHSRQSTTTRIIPRLGGIQMRWYYSCFGWTLHISSFNTSTPIWVYATFVLAPTRTYACWWAKLSVFVRAVVIFICPPPPYFSFIYLNN